MPWRALTIAVLFLVPMGIGTLRLSAADWRLERLLPQRAYRLQMLLSFEAHDSSVEASTFLPVSDDRQTVFDEQNSSPGLSFELQRTNGNRAARWSSGPNSRLFDVVYEYHVIPRAIRFLVPEGAAISKSYPPIVESHLGGTEFVQVDDPAIGELLDRIAPQPRFLRETLDAIQDYTRNELKTVTFKGTTDALTALRLGRASCNGKSRLFVALARRAGIPARLVGGIILNEGSKRTTHQWVETFVNGYWVPYCPTNGYSAELPSSYVVFYRGDHTLFRHSPNVNFDYTFKIRGDLREASGFHTAGIGLDPWSLFHRLGIPLDILKVILLLPIGATVLVVIRNVIGIDTYGIFLPVLIAAAARNTGLYWGLIGVVLVIALAATLRACLGRFSLLHTPKLVVLFTFVIVVMLAIGVFGARYGFTDVAHVSLFPIAILTMATERFVVKAEEYGLRKAASLLVTTLVAVYCCYQVIGNRGLQAVFLGFPEMLLMTVGINVLLAQWVGIRLSEYVRFRHLIFGQAGARA